MPELLSPAGDFASAKAAINAGADAVYLGGKSFSARSFAQNFTEEELDDIINYAALRNVKIYIAINTLYSNEEIPRVLEFATNMYKSGASAFILQDIGLASLLKDHLPEIELHASTQMTIHSANGVKYMEQLGFSRVILSRELSLPEIKKINKSVNIGTEVFVHGAMCVSYSGQCLMSSLLGGRSGNRGKCAQPCRLPYTMQETKGYLLSPKDMMTLEILDEITESGVSALKIEGRMKSPEYVYTVTKAYRDKLDGHKPDIEAVKQIFNRGGGFSTGYYYGNIEIQANKELSKPNPSPKTKIAEKKRNITGEIKIKINQPAKIKLENISKESPVKAEKAISAPMSREEIVTQLSKTGNSPFKVSYKKIDIDEGIFISKQALNQLRRDATEALEAQIIAEIKRKTK